MPSRDRGKLVNSPFSSFKGTCSCRPNKNRATKNTPKGNDARTELFFVIYIYFSCSVEGDGGKNLTKKVQQAKQQPCAFITLESSTSPSLPATQQCTTAVAMACKH